VGRACCFDSRFMLASFLINKMTLVSTQNIVVVQLTKLLMKLAVNFEDGLSKYT